jgi:hypothetical protein
MKKQFSGLMLLGFLLWGCCGSTDCPRGVYYKDIFGHSAPWEMTFDVGDESIILYQNRYLSEYHETTINDCNGEGLTCHPHPMSYRINSDSLTGPIGLFMTSTSVKPDQDHGVILRLTTPEGSGQFTVGVLPLDLNENSESYNLKLEGSKEIGDKTYFNVIGCHFINNEAVKSIYLNQGEGLLQFIITLDGEERIYSRR